MQKEMVWKKKVCTLALLGGIYLLTACGQSAEENSGRGQEEVPKQDGASEETLQEEEGAPGSDASEEVLLQEIYYIDPEGTTLEARIRTPEGFERVSAEQGSFAEFLRGYPVKEDGSPVLLYDGKEKGNQAAHAAVLALPIEAEDLQQCADSVMRIYAEYFYATGKYDRIVFHFTNGFAAEYTKWREGYRISVEGNQVFWVKSAEYDDSYETFVKYMRIVFAYAGTLSMENESEAISMEEVRAGDIFLRGGSPGHVVMVLDVCEDAQGKKALLLGQGYMPAQEFHVLKNPAHEEDPWYYEDVVAYPLLTPEYSFAEGSLKRLNY